MAHKLGDLQNYILRQIGRTPGRSAKDLSTLLREKRVFQRPSEVNRAMLTPIKMGLVVILKAALLDGRPESELVDQYHLTDAGVGYVTGIFGPKKENPTNV